MATRCGEGERAVIAKVGELHCAIPVRSVSEVMRPLPVETFGDLPAFVRGLSVIRGTPVPVVSLGLLIGNRQESAQEGRFVAVRTGERTVALLVDEVVGVRTLRRSAFEDLPSLLTNPDTDYVQALIARDEGLFVVVRAARILSEEIWDALALGGDRRGP